MVRCKTMPLGEWAPFQDRFEEVFTNALAGDRRFALFIEAGPAGEPRTLLIPQHESELVEALAPGGWEDCNDATERRWTLLVGHADANEEFGLPPTR